MKWGRGQIKFISKRGTTWRDSCADPVEAELQARLVIDVSFIRPPPPSRAALGCCAWRRRAVAGSVCKANAQSKAPELPGVQTRQGDLNRNYALRN